VTFRPDGLPEEDLEDIDARLAPHRDHLRGRQVFLTGGTGFIGRWLVESFGLANSRHALGADLTVLSRNPERHLQRTGHSPFAAAASFVRGDVRTFELTPPPRLDFVIHAAADASETLNREEPLTMLDVIVHGTRRVLYFAFAAKARRVLFLSSGAVYGPQPPDLAQIPEEFSGGPDLRDPRSAYAEGKRLAEVLCAAYARTHGLEVVTARGFAFVGPGLPLDRHFAAGNFVRDALDRNTITVQGDGTPLRSYLYAADLAVWLWTMLLAAPPGRVYNVGSEREVSIADLAAEAARLSEPALPVRIARQAAAGAPPQRYIPSTLRATRELGLTETIGLPEALRKTFRWHRQQVSDKTPVAR